MRNFQIVKANGLKFGTQEVIVCVKLKFSILSRLLPNVYIHILKSTNSFLSADGAVVNVFDMFTRGRISFQSEQFSPLSPQQFQGKVTGNHP